MTNQIQPIQKESKNILFEARVNWMSKQKGILSGTDVSGTIHVATPPAFGGEGKCWSPEHLFLGSLSSCFMTTYLAFAKKFKLEITGLECGITGVVAMSEGKFRFTQINLFPKIYVKDESLRSKSDMVLEKTKKYCLISGSVNAEIIYQCEVIVATEQPINLELLDSNC
jgi:peroxiredoxin-like protein